MRSCEDGGHHVRAGGGCPGTGIRRDRLAVQGTKPSVRVVVATVSATRSSTASTARLRRSRRTSRKRRLTRSPHSTIVDNRDRQGDGRAFAEPRLVHQRTVAHRQDPVSSGGDARVVSHDHHGCPASCSRSSSRSTSRVAVESRLPVGSSASTTRGSLLSARAMATRWRWPPDSADGSCALDPPAPLLEQVTCPTTSRGGPTGPPAGPELDILQSGELVHQVERLEDEADPNSHESAFARSDSRSIRTSDHQICPSRPVEPAEQVEESGLPAAAGPGHRHCLPLGDHEVDLVDGADQSLSAAIVLATPRALSGASGRGLDGPTVAGATVQVSSQASSQRRSARAAA